MIRNLCQLHTSLDDQDIHIIEKLSEHIQLMADLNQAEIFIDCLTRKKDIAIVVAEAYPKKSKINYVDSVVGKYAFRSNEPAALRTLELGIPTRDLSAKTQEDIYVNQAVEPIKNPSGQTIACLIMETSIAEQERNEAKIKMLSETTENLANAILDYHSIDSILEPYLNDGLIWFDQKGQVKKANQAAKFLYQKLGYFDDIEGLSFDNITLDGRAFKEILSQENLLESEINISNMSFYIKYAQLNDEKGQLHGVLTVIKDVTHEKTIEKELISKSMAIREIHHRVKNNLQTIASLLRLQSRRVHSEEVKSAFDDSINRIMSIAVTHETLAQKGLDDVDVKMILDRLVKNTITSSQGLTRMTIDLQGESLMVKSDRATSIALVVNELVQNSIKHAFKGQTDGCIKIRISRGRQFASVLVEDNGIGFDTHNHKSNQLGMKIVESIVQDKLKGRFSIESSNLGTRSTFDFEIESF